MGQGGDGVGLFGELLFGGLIVVNAKWRLDDLSFIFLVFLFAMVQLGLSS